MIIENLKLSGFRNLKKYETSFGKNRNLIFGLNGVGKTSILEAIFLLGYGKSFLNRKKSDMVNHDFDEFIIRLTCTTSYGLNRVSARYDNRFSLFLNEKKTNIFEINHHFYPVFFSSSDYNLYIESIPYTRKMIDRFIFGVNSLYIRYILCYNRALKQKNYLLKTTGNRAELTSWNKIVSELAKKIVGIKMNFIEKLNIEIKNIFDAGLTFAYRPSFEIDNGISEAVFFERLESLQTSELRAQRSLLGPHLDGIDLRLNSRHLKFYSSGEKKIHLLMVYISFIELFRRVKEEYPVFLLDDFDTAIDSKNIDFLMQNYPDMQVIATSVSKNRNFDRLLELKKEN
ncbi:MAG: DNA replication and repair protein RecF [Candidatus Aminicenantes bacterium]|nr:MAG: DNA replication and repair protein RecF [Candidatus Aminicenantes bacterium]